jgi:hypothetical protein
MIIYLKKSTVRTFSKVAEQQIIINYAISLGKL